MGLLVRSCPAGGGEWGQALALASGDVPLEPVQTGEVSWELGGCTGGPAGDPRCEDPFAGGRSDEGGKGGRGWRLIRPPAPNRYV